MSVRGIRNALASLVPKWLSNRPGFNAGFRILDAIATQIDMLEGLAVEGVLTWFPGYSLPSVWPFSVDATTALPLVGRSRGQIRGEADTDAGYAAKLIPWLDNAIATASSKMLAKQIQSYLGNTPMVRVINRKGFFVTVDQSGNVTAQQSTWTWNWDGQSDPTQSSWWSDLWIVVYPTEWAQADTIVNSSGLTHDGEGIGHLCTQTAVDAILGLVRYWKGAHSWVVAILWSYDNTLFDPNVVNAGNPDGWWGRWGKQDGTGGTGGGGVIAARSGSCRYWIPLNGG